MWKKQLVYDYLYTLISHDKISLQLFGYSSLQAALEWFWEMNSPKPCIHFLAKNT